MCEAFSNAGIEIELWIPKRFNAIKEQPFEYYGMREIFPVKKLPAIDLIPFSKFFGFFANLVESASFALFAYFRLPKNGGHLIYSRDHFLCWFLSFFNKKFVYEIHSFPKNFRLHKRIWRRARKIIAITAGLKSLLVENGVEAAKILVAPDAVDLAVFNAIAENKDDLRAELGLSKDDFLVGYVGKFKTLGMEKGIKTMIEALPLLDKGVKMVFAGGEEPELREYRTLAGRFNVLPQCIFVGYQPYAKMARYMKAADALAIPFPNRPHYAFYASPLKLFEYMASGRPIIASDLPALREILNDKNALFFKPENAADMARAVKMLKNSQMLGYHLSQQALADVKEHTWDNRAKKILEFIK